MVKTSKDGFTRPMHRRPLTHVMHFEGGTMQVVTNDEGGLWNRKPLKKFNKDFKTSHVFDAFTKDYETVPDYSK